PAGAEDADLDQHGAREISEAAQLFRKTHQRPGAEGGADDGQADERKHGSDEGLQNDEAQKKAAGDHLGENLDGFLGLIESVNEVENFERKIDDQRVEEEGGELIEAAHLQTPADDAGQKINDQHHANARDDGRKQEDHGDQDAAPPRIRLDGPEQEADVTVQ